MYTKQKVKDWQNATIEELKLLYKGTPDGKVEIDYMFYVQDLRRRDTDNMVCQVNDALVQAGLLEDDSWKHLKLGSADAELDRENPRAEIVVRDM